MNKRIKISLIITIVLILLIIVITILTKGTKIDNPSKDKTAMVTSEIQKFNIQYIYDENMPKNADPITIQEGVNGLSYTYDGINYIHLSDASDQIVKVGTKEETSYNGKLTSYGPDCPGCSLEGNVSCMTKNGTKHSLKNNGIYYEDEIYGKVRIVAAANSLFSCGTILKIDNGKEEPFYAVVLDTGGSMKSAWTNGNVWVDLAFASQADAKNSTSSSENTNFVVQRWGW